MRRSPPLAKMSTGSLSRSQAMHNDMHHPLPTPPHRKRRAPARLLVALVLCVVLTTTFPTPTIAGDPSPPIAALPPGAPAAASDPSGAMLWVYVVALVLSCGMFGLYFLKRARQRRAFLALDTTPAPRPLRSHAPPSEPGLAAMTAHPAPQPGGGNPAMLTEQLRRALIATRAPEETHRECPTCQRRFASWMSVCPFDATPLHTTGVVREPGAEEETLGRMMCTTCDRRYGPDATFCPHDATRLSPDTLEASRGAPTFYVCRACGHSSANPDATCACSAPERIRLDASQTGHKALALPISVCPVCHEHGALGQTHCAHDGEVLVPMTTIQAGVFPDTGHGSRRKICPQCGTRHGGAQTFCCHDGARLRDLH